MTHDTPLFSLHQNSKSGTLLISKHQYSSHNFFGNKIIFIHFPTHIFRTHNFQTLTRYRMFKIIKHDIVKFKNSFQNIELIYLIFFFCIFNGNL